MDAFADRLARLAELTPDEIEALEAELVAAFDAADSSGDVDLMQALADALDTVRAAKTATPPEEAAPAAPGQAAPVAAAADMLDTVATDVPEVPEVPTPDVPEAPAPGEVPAEPEVPEGTPPEPAVPATDDEILKALVKLTEAELKTLALLPEEDRQALAQMAIAAQSPIPTEAEQVAPELEQQEEPVSTAVVTQSDVPDANKPVPVAASAMPFTITAGGDIPGVTSGQKLDGMDDVVEAMTKKINSMRGVGGDGEYVIVASLRRDEDSVDEDKMLRKADPEGNSAKIRKFLQENSSREAMTAAGWCAPRTPLYDIPGIGSTDTPVADSMASFGVDRGGIIWTEPPSIGGVIASMGANAFVRWDPNAATGSIAQTGVIGTTPTVPPDLKPCIDISCGVERHADLIALPMCLCFDLLSSRTNPEFVKAATDLVQVAQAHFKEQYLLAAMWSAPGVVNHSAANIYGTPDVKVGIARDWLITIRVVAAQFRWRNRLSATQQVRVYAPAWLRDAVAADLMLQMPGDDTMSTSYAEVDGYLDDANIDPVWFIDDVPAVGDNVVAATANFDSYLGFPLNAEWLVTTPGVFTRLDGGQVDLGVVRTKDDVQKNKFCEFAETFETVAYMGPQDAANAWAVRGTTPVLIAGATALGVNTATGVINE